jgi:hypothetical protein
MSTNFNSIQFGGYSSNLNYVGSQNITIYNNSNHNVTQRQGPFSFVTPQTLSTPQQISHANQKAIQILQNLSNNPNINDSDLNGIKALSNSIDQLESNFGANSCGNIRYMIGQMNIIVNQKTVLMNVDPRCERANYSFNRNHIQQRHCQNGTKCSRFYNANLDQDLQAKIKETINNGHEYTINTKYGMRQVYEYDFSNQLIGEVFVEDEDMENPTPKVSNGLRSHLSKDNHSNTPTSKMRVVIDDNLREIITAYPIPSHR